MPGTSMNIHHLELFYYVARFGGISEAVRSMPYGIQQPAISSQILQLEATLGVTLFQRRPFHLLPPGEVLFEFVRPFFDQLENIEVQIRSGGHFEHIRIGAAEIILRDYLPESVRTLQRKFPSLKVTLRSGYLPQLESWLQKREIDLAVTLLVGEAPPGICTQPLIDLPLGLLVPQASPLTSADQLWSRDRIEETLISLPARESVASTFQSELERRGVDWFPGLEVSSLDVVEAYVRNGYGIGLTVMVPSIPRAGDLRVIPLPDFPWVTFGVHWNGRRTNITNAFIEDLESRAKTLRSEIKRTSMPPAAAPRAAKAKRGKRAAAR
jgi:DNA-binding transcriptional LysR family regulator